MARDEAARMQRSDAAVGSDIPRAASADPASAPDVPLGLRAATDPMTALPLSDRDERVRVLLIRKLAALTPGLTEAAHGRLHEDTIEALANLVAAEAERVRASIAEAVKHLPDAPRALILRLAADPAVMVCEPIIRFSPVLTSADLVALIIAAPSPGTVRAAARRPGIDAALCDAIVEVANTDTIRALIANPSAQIREATLDALIARAACNEAWHEPLVRRPWLPAHAAQALSRIVADHLLEVLLARPDLDPALAYDLRDRLRQTAPPVAAPDAIAQGVLSRAKAIENASLLRDNGRLNDASILTAAQRGDAILVSAMLAVKAALPLAVIERAAGLRSAKGLVSLSWKAGLSMRAAVAVQVLVGHLPPESVIHPRSGGGYPMSPQEMRWQLEFLGRTGR